MAAGSIESIYEGVRRVYARLNRATAALADIPHAVVGEMAVALWIESVDESAVRTTPEVKLLVRREDIGRIAEALMDAGFVRVSDARYDERPDERFPKRVDLVFAGDLVRAGESVRYPSPVESQIVLGRHVLKLHLLVECLATSHRTIDRVVLRDLMDVGLVDFSWPERFTPPRSDRLLFLLNDPHG